MLYKQLLVSFVSSSSCLLFHSSYVFNRNLYLKKKSVSLQMMKLRLSTQDRPSSAATSQSAVQAGGRRLQQPGGCRTLPSPSCTLPAPRGGGNIQAITFTLLLPSLPGEQGYKAVAPRDRREPGAGQRHPAAPHPSAPNSSPRSQHSHFGETKLQHWMSLKTRSSVSLHNLA